MSHRHPSLTSFAAIVGLAATTLVVPRTASACGAMVFHSHAERAGGMNGQELFLSLGSDATTLVISASFIDADGEKAFLLPIRAVPDEVLDADDALFVALETGTVPVVTISEAEDEPTSTGCGSKAAGDVGGGGFGEGEVDVLDRGSTATYDYVVVGGDTGSSLADWLTAAGFAVPAEFDAALDEYANDDWYFLAAKLKSDAPEGRIAPLELRLPATAPAFTIPFGIGSHGLTPEDELDITLYVASQSTVLPQNYAVEAIDDDIEATSAESSNYADLFEAAVGDEPTWVVEYSYGNWTTSSLDDWVVGNWEYGINLDPEVDREWLSDFHQRLGYDRARLTRLRTRLAGSDLVDMDLDAAADIDVDRDHYVTWDPSEGCGVAPSPANGLAWMGLLALLRRRRR